MKYRRIPVTSEITAEMFDGNTTKSDARFRITDEGTWQIYNGLHNSWINIKMGDFYRTDIEGDTYPIDAEYMKKNYEEVK